jgi:hypothetical protein
VVPTAKAIVRGAVRSIIICVSRCIACCTLHWHALPCVLHQPPQKYSILLAEPHPFLGVSGSFTQWTGQLMYLQGYWKLLCTLVCYTACLHCVCCSSKLDR